MSSSEPSEGVDPSSQCKIYTFGREGTANPQCRPFRCLRVVLRGRCCKAIGPGAMSPSYRHDGPCQGPNAPKTDRKWNAKALSCGYPHDGESHSDMILAPRPRKVSMIGLCDKAHEDSRVTVSGLRNDQTQSELCDAWLPWTSSFHVDRASVLFTRGSCHVTPSEFLRYTAGSFIWLRAIVISKDGREPRVIVETELANSS